MKISLEPEFSGGQDIHQKSCNFKNFSVVTVPFLCREIFFILLRRVFVENRKVLKLFRFSYKTAKTPKL
jgi:hypothetical protein